jgi:hypothetical protein
MIDTTKPTLVLTLPLRDFDKWSVFPGYVKAPGGPYTSLPEAAKAVSRLAKAGVKNLRVRRFHNGEVTNLKD